MSKDKMPKTEKENEEALNNAYKLKAALNSINTVIQLASTGTTTKQET